MSASLCIDTSDIQSGALTVGNVGGGVLAEDIATGYEHESYLANDRAMPGDTGKEFRGQILTVPSAGTFFAHENGAITFLDAPDGAYTFSYQLIVDYANVGSPVTSNINVGAGNYSVARAETNAITDAATAAYAALAAQAETNAITDAATATLSAPGDYLRDVGESAVATDAITSSAAQSAIGAETAAASDSATIVAALDAARAESVAAGDTCSAVLNAAPETYSAVWTFDVAGRDYRFAVLARDYRYEVH